MNFAALVAPTLILVAGVINDLRSRSVRNWLVLICAAVALSSQIALNGWNGFALGGLGLALASALSLPLVMMRVLGAGDMKLFMAFGLSTNTETVVFVGIASLFAGALLGLLRAILSGEGKLLVQNTALLFKGVKLEEKNTHKIPFTVAIFFGWMTYVALQITGVKL